MAHHKTYLNQIAVLVHRYQFKSVAKEHHVGQKIRSFNRLGQFLAIKVAQLSGWKSLRDLTANLQALGQRFYHFGLRTISKGNSGQSQRVPTTWSVQRSLLFVAQPLPTLYSEKQIQGQWQNLSARCNSHQPLSQNLPMGHFQKKQGSRQAAFRSRCCGYLPVFMDMMKGKFHESTWARALNLPSGSTVVFDRGFNDYYWYQSLIDHQVVFVARLISNAVFEPLEKRRGRKGQGICGDRRIRLKDMISYLRIVDFTDSTNGKTYRVLTKSYFLKANVIVELYKERLKIEMFFKWIKQNLLVKAFLGSSLNAVMTQLWIAMCVYVYICC